MGSGVTPVMRISRQKGATQEMCDISEQRRSNAAAVLCRQRALPMLGGIHTVDRVGWEREARKTVPRSNAATALPFSAAPFCPGTQFLSLFGARCFKRFAGMVNYFLLHCFEMTSLHP